jgi:hypothetical protein
MEGNGLILANTRTVPPMHRVHVNIGALRQTSAQLVIAELLPATMIWVYCVRDKGYDWSPSWAHGIRLFLDLGNVGRSHSTRYSPSCQQSIPLSMT